MLSNHKFKSGIALRQAGFTLLELIIAMAIFGLVAAGVVTFSLYYLNSYSFSLAETQAVSQAQNALTMMLREIREARMSEDGAWPLFLLTETELSFYGDVTNDGMSDKVRYFIEGGQLKKGVIEPTGNPIAYLPENEKIKVVADFVDNAGSPLFTYYNGDWPADQINNPLIASERLLNTRYIEIYLIININPNTVEPYGLRSGVQLRNLKDNL